MRYPEFKGWDWTEVVYYFDRSKKFDFKKPAEEKKEAWVEYEDRMAKDFSEWLWKNYKSKVAVKVCRLYTKKVAEESYSHLYTGPLWNGLYEIESDEMFIKYFIQLMQGMWT